MDEKEIDETVRRLVEALKDYLVLLLRLARSGSVR
jgi:hypothetical protein